MKQEETPLEFSNELVKKYEKYLIRKAPLALKTAMKLVDDGEKLSLESALKLELAALKDIFATQDAYIGLSSLMTKSKPVYTAT